MMKNTIIALVLLAIVFIIIYFIPVKTEKSYLVKSTFDNVLELLNKPQNWEKWHPFFKDLPTKNENDIGFYKNPSGHAFSFGYGNDSLKVDVINPMFYSVDEQKEGKDIFYGFEIIPSSSTVSITVKYIEKKSLLDYFSGFFRSGKGEKRVEALQYFVTDPKKLYGYDVKTIKVIDTTFIVENFTVSADDLFHELTKKKAELQHYISEYNLTDKGFISVSFISQNDSVKGIIGIPVNHAAKASGNITFANIPKGKMLTADYKGRFDKKGDVYKAIKKYAIDNSLKNVGAPFESYYNDSLPSSDTLIVHFKLYYPIL